MVGWITVKCWANSLRKHCWPDTCKNQANSLCAQLEVFLSSYSPIVAPVEHELVLSACTRRCRCAWYSLVESLAYSVKITENKDHEVSLHFTRIKRITPQILQFTIVPAFCSKKIIYLPLNDRKTRFAMTRPSTRGDDMLVTSADTDTSSMCDPGMPCLPFSFSVNPYKVK